jgi:polyisoprenoid-binding protein YceI
VGLSSKFGLGLKIIVPAVWRQFDKAVTTARFVVSNINSEPPFLCQRASHVESVVGLLADVMRRNGRISVFAFLLGTSLAQTLPIDTEHSVITVHVFKSGLFSAFADNHEIRAPISSGLLDEAARRVEIVVDSRKLVVLDPNLPPEKRQQVQERMLGPEVLDSNQFHEIRFQANDVKEESADHFLLAGTLSLHGKTRAISLHVVRSSGHYRGDVMLKQRDFAITPVTVAGGTVRVKDELKIELDISAEARPKQAEDNR